MADDKYKMFRNFMTNELGISKQDIEEWTKQAVTAEVNKRLNGLDFESVTRATINKTVKETVFGVGFQSCDGIKKIREEVAGRLAEQLVISTKAV